MRYGIVVADPPWSFSDKLTMSDVKRGAEAHYGTLALADLLRLPIRGLGEADSILALWVPSALLESGLAVMKAWGYEHKTIFTWVKTAGGPTGLAMGMGRTFRACSEHALIGKRGSPEIMSKSERSVELHKALSHSSKPEGLQERLERMMPEANKLELFARRARPGWTCVGNEAPDTLGVDIREWAYKAVMRGSKLRAI